LKAVLGSDLAFALFFTGWLADAARVSEEVRIRSAADMALGIDMVGFSAFVAGHFSRATVLSELGRIDEAKSDARRAIELAQELGPDESRSWANFFLASIGLACGDASVMAQSAHRAFEFAERSGSQYAMAMALVAQSYASELEAQWERALNAAEAAIAIWKRGFLGEFAPRILASKARALRGLGDIGQSRNVSLEAMQLAVRQQEPVLWCEGAITLVHCLQDMHGAEAKDQIEDLLVRVVSLIDQTGAERWRPHVHEARAEMHVLLGQSSQAKEEFSRALELFCKTGATGHARRIQERLEERAFPVSS
jgi:tetratricopeptide (TPR) repeat protein